MDDKISLHKPLSFWTDFNVQEQEFLLSATEAFMPGGFAKDFITRSHYTLGSLFFPAIASTGPSAFIQNDGIVIHETFIWEGMFYLDKNLHGNYFKVKFDRPHIFNIQTTFSTEFQRAYPSCYELPSEADILKAVTTLMIARLSSTSVLYFFLTQRQRLEKSFMPVFEAIGKKEIHLGVLKRIATEPFDHSAFSSQCLSWTEINRRASQSHTDIKRSYDTSIRVGIKRWMIAEKEVGASKAHKFNAALAHLQKEQLLPGCVLDALRLGAHQSGFLNEALIALGVYITEMSQYKITLPQSGVKRHVRFTVVNRQVEVKDKCYWNEVGAPPKNATELHSLEREHVTLTNPLELTYRYTLKACEGNRLHHQIQELSLKHEGRVKALL